MVLITNWIVLDNYIIISSNYPSSPLNLGSGLKKFSAPDRCNRMVLANSGPGNAVDNVFMDELNSFR